MSKIKNGGLDQYSAEPFEQQQFGRAGIEGVEMIYLIIFDATAVKKWNSYTCCHANAWTHCLWEILPGQTPE